MMNDPKPEPIVLVQHFIPNPGEITTSHGSVTKFKNLYRATTLPQLIHQITGLLLMLFQFIKGDKHLPSNYRSISLTSIVIKVMKGLFIVNFPLLWSLTILLVNLSMAFAINIPLSPAPCLYY